MIVPIFLVRDVAEAVSFLSRVLDFEVEYVTATEPPFYAVLRRGANELHLNLVHGEKVAGCSSAIVVCENVDALFAAFLERGLVVPVLPDSPVHMAPTDQSWGTREVYIDDPSGNTIVFQQRSMAGVGVA